MNVQAKKLELVQLILETNKPALLDEIIKILKKEKDADWWDEIPESVRKSIDIALKQANRGETIPHSEVLKEAKEKYGL